MPQVDTTETKRRRRLRGGGELEALAFPALCTKIKLQLNGTGFDRDTSPQFGQVSESMTIKAIRWRCGPAFAPVFRNLALSG